MNLPKYPVTASDDLLVYEFFSEGPRGRIKKGVFYTRIGKDLYDLGFGDWIEALQDLDDSSRTNNGDRDKVLATVASTAIAFTNRFPTVRIFIEGSTAARTRLYQIGIGFNLDEISENFDIPGFTGEEWQIFRRGRNYTAFLISRK
jgi:hypothetical protein